MPWSGPRDPSCDTYYSARYKKPLYDATAINEHLISVLGVENSPKLFYRWERPVRYYLEVPSDHPQLAQQFEEQVAQIAKYTGLDIARHDKPYLEYKDPKRNDKSKWPGGLSTNIVFVVTTDVEATVSTPLMGQLLAGFGVSAQQEMTNWNSAKNMGTQTGSYSILRYSYDPGAFKFIFNVREIGSEDLKSIKNKKQYEPGWLKAEAYYFMSIFLEPKKYINTMLSGRESNLTDFDKQFLRVLYGRHVHSGMRLLKAKRLMMEELVDCFNAGRS